MRAPARACPRCRRGRPRPVELALAAELVEQRLMRLLRDAGALPVLPARQPRSSMRGGTWTIQAICHLRVHRLIRRVQASLPDGFLMGS
jgi:hypothetical protein